MPYPRDARRRAMMTLLAGSTALAGVMAAGLALASSSAPLGGTPITGALLREPQAVTAVDGVTSATLTAKAAVTRIAGRRVVSTVFNGEFPAPTLVVRPGDLLRIADVNQMPTDPTNIHVHGLHVSPSGHGDNVFVNTPAGHTFVNSYRISKNQIPGLYWYHPHRHMYADNQVSPGMAGAIVVKGSIDEIPGIRDRRDRVMVFQRAQVGTDGRVVTPPLDTTKMHTYINGQLQPVIDIRPGEIQRWRIANAQGDSFLRLNMGGRTFWTIGTDGNPEPRPVATDTMLIPPGGRREVLVRGGSPGTMGLTTLGWGEGPQTVAPAVLATVRSAGIPVTGEQLPGAIYNLPDLRTQTVAQHRDVTFSFVPLPDGSPQWAINGKMYDDYTSSTNLFQMKLGTTEEWTLRNTTTEYHPFHIHVNPFQVVSINGVPQKAIDYRDTVPIPPNGTVVIRQRFTDFTGRFVIHCHILFHEDHGMMAPIKVVR